jgi:hypothetical protein
MLGFKAFFVSIMVVVFATWNAHAGMYRSAID